MFLYNAWYVAAWSKDITTKPLARTLLNEPIVLFRNDGGIASALEDRCCHRGMPLSCGQIIGANIRCEYHGMVFDGSGKCVEIPGQKIIPNNARVRSFPVTECDDLVWIWMGDAALADAKKIVRYPWHHARPSGSIATICCCRTICSIRPTPLMCTSPRLRAMWTPTSAPK
jgi:phenylpropionate dioxygenase-like ring-hydroxylating dioxygenase large terminal subunit